MIRSTVLSGLPDPRPCPYAQDMEEVGSAAAVQHYNRLVVEARAMTAEADALLQLGEMDGDELGDC